MGRRSPSTTVSLPEHKIVQQLSVAKNSIQAEHKNLQDKTKKAQENLDAILIHTADAEVAHKRTLSNLAAAQSLLQSTEEDIKRKKDVSSGYDIEFSKKVASERQKISELISDLKKEEEKQAVRTSDLKLNNDALQAKHEKELIETASQLTLNDNFRKENEKLCMIISENKNTIENQNIILSAQEIQIKKNESIIFEQSNQFKKICDDIDTVKNQIIEGKKTIDDINSLMIRKKQELSAKENEIEQMTKTIIDVAIRDKKLNEFARMLEKKAREMNIQIKLT